MASTSHRDPWQPLLAELRAIRALLERGGGSPDGQERSPSVPATPPPAAVADGLGGGLRMLRFRLDRLAALVERVAGRLGDGELPVRRRELRAIVGDLHERVRDARHSLGALAEYLDRGGQEGGAVPAGLRETLNELDDGLRRSRQALAGLAESLGRPPGGER